MISIKSHKEIEIMRKAGEIVALVLQKLEEEIAPGITTMDLDKITEELIRKNNAIPSFKGYPSFIDVAPDFPASICASVNNEVIHGIPGLRRLENGDIISIDVGAYYDGYHGDAARTFAVGTVSEEVDKLIRVTEESFFQGIKKAVPDNRIVDISAEIQNYVERYGFSVVRDFVGHGIGREMHEPPQIPNYKTRQRGLRIQSGMTFAIEPMVNQGRPEIKMLDNMWTIVTQDGSLSAHYENTIVITNDMPMILTKLS